MHILTSLLHHIYVDVDLYNSDSDNEDEVDPVEGEEDIVETETQGDQVHEVISVDNTESMETNGTRG